MLRILFVALLVLAGAAGIQAKEVAGVSLAERIELAGQPLVLNGAGVRSKFFFDIYVGALYLPEPARDPETIYAMSGPKRVLMNIRYKALSKEKLVAAWTEGFEANLSRVELERLLVAIERFNALFTDVKQGDWLTVDLLSGQGVRVSLNGEVLGTVTEAALKSALLRIWLGDEPADEELKRALLGAG